jgi:hypothetical protein
VEAPVVVDHAGPHPVENRPVVEQPVVEHNNPVEKKSEAAALQANEHAQELLKGVVLEKPAAIKKYERPHIPVRLPFKHFMRHSHPLFLNRRKSPYMTR